MATAGNYQATNDDFKHLNDGLPADMARLIAAGAFDDALRLIEAELDAGTRPELAACLRAERARILRACMAELHADYREALFLVYFEGLSHAETAAVMGKREKQVADLIYRGKNALRKRLEQEGITDAYNG